MALELFEHLADPLLERRLPTTHRRSFPSPAAPAARGRLDSRDLYASTWFTSSERDELRDRPAQPINARKQRARGDICSSSLERPSLNENRGQGREEWPVRRGELPRA